MTDAEKQLCIAFKECFKTIFGLKVLEHLSNFCYESRNTFVEGRPDVQNCNNGRRAVILEIRRILDRDVDAPEIEQQKDTNYI